MKRARSYSKSKAPAKKFKKYSKNMSREMTPYNNNRVHFVKRHADYTTLAVSNTSGANAGYTFRLNNVPGYTELTGLYDQYKICGVKVTFNPPVTQRTNISTVDNPDASARFLSAIDYNDSTAPTSGDDVRQYENCKVTTFHEKHTRYIDKPKFVNTSGQTVSDWMSTANATTIWYGLKVWVDPTNQTSTLSSSYTVECVFYLCFKNIK